MGRSPISYLGLAFLLLFLGSLMVVFAGPSPYVGVEFDDPLLGNIGAAIVFVGFLMFIAFLLVFSRGRG